jgi:hypothetical protein
VVDATGYAKTVVRPMILHSALPSSLYFQTVTLAQADFDGLNASGQAAPGSGIVAVTVVPVGACKSDGSGVTLTPSPASGRVEYVSSGDLPADGGASSTGSTATTAFNAYVIGADPGSISVLIASTASCAAAPFPVSPQPFFSVPSAMGVVSPSVLTQLNVFLK